MRKKLLALLLCAVTAASLLAGCGSAAGAKTAASGGKLGISVSVGGEDSMVVNTGKVGTLEGLSACRHLYEGLYKIDQTGKPVLGQAKNVQVSADGLTYTFTLRDDIKWSDGKPVTAADFIYGWKYLKDCALDYSDLMSMVKSTEAKDDKTLVVTLTFPCSYLPSVLAFPSAYPVREDIVKKYGDAYATDPDKAVYNGAYSMTSWTHQQEMVMEARKDYYDASNISVGKITWDLMTDTSTMLASFQSGDIIYSDSYPQDSAASLKGKGLQATSGYNTYCTLFNVSKSGPAVLKDAKVREAMSLAIDRNRLISIRGLGDKLADTYSPDGLKDSSGKEFNSTVTPWFDASAYQANCAKAKDLLKQAGYENGKGFPSLTYIVNNDDRKEIAEAVVSDWKSVLGISSVTVQTIDGFYAQRQSHEFDLAYFGWYMDYPDISNMLYTFKSGVSDSGYTNKDYDTAFDAAIAEKDTAKQWADYQKCESTLAADMPVIPLFHSQNTYLFDDTKYNGLVYYCGNVFFGYVKEK